MTDFDLAVIGGGPGGYPCAIRAAQLGLKTVLIEYDRLGGECLNYGCIPSKALIGVAKLYDRLGSAGKFGIKVSGLEVDFGALQSWKKGVVDTIVSGVEQLCRGYGVTVLKGRAELKDRNTMAVTDGGSVKDVSFAKLVIATGSFPAELPNLKYDGRLILGSREFLDLSKVPTSILVVGGGVVGLEIASMYSKFGTRVTVVEMMEQLLPGMDADLVRVVHRGLERRGVTIRLKSTVSSVEKLENSVRASVQTPEGDMLQVEAEKVLLSVGRRPRTAGLGLERLGVATDQKGFVITDRRMMTNVEGVYAVGDVRGPPMLAHKATKEGLVAAESASGLPTEAQWKTMPDAVFTDPEIATAGITEAKALSLGRTPKVTRYQFAALGRALAAGEPEGFLKLVSDTETGLVLGVQIVGHEASDLISEAALAIEMGATVEDLALTVHPHPTMPEALMEAAESAAGHPVNQLRLMKN